MDIDSHEFQKKHRAGTYVGIEVFFQIALFMFSYMVYKTCKSSIITITSLFLFLVQQMSILFQTYPPATLTDFHKHQSQQADFRVKLTLCFFAFVSMVGTFLPFRHYMIPVTLFYTTIFWLPYLSETQPCDLTGGEMRCQYFMYMMICVGAGYVA